MAEVSSLWIGEKLQWMQRLSIESFLDHGIDFTLYYYGEPPADVPHRAQTLDAEQVLPFHVLQDFARLPAMAADLFRYRLLSIKTTVWVDLDVICMSSDFPTAGQIIGKETNEILNNAVLSVGQDKELAGFLFNHSLETLKSSGAGWTKLPWGTLGPKLVTEFWPLREPGGGVMPQHCFYAVPPSEFWHFWVPWRARGVFRRIRTSYGVHLWNELYSRLGLNPSECFPHPRSFLGKLCKTHGVSIGDNSISGLLLESKALRSRASYFRRYMVEVIQELWKKF